MLVATHSPAPLELLEALEYQASPVGQAEMLGCKFLNEAMCVPRYLNVTGSQMQVECRFLKEYRYSQRG